MPNKKKTGRMKAVLSLSLLVTLALALTGCPTPQAPPSSVCVDFEPPLVVGTQYGTPAGQTPGTVIFTSHGIPVTLQNFDFAGGGSTFSSARIEVPPASFNTTQAMRTNNINLEFNFTAVSFQTREVRFDFFDQGGSENISVNGSPVVVGDMSSVPTPIGGVNVAISFGPTAGGQKGTVTLTGVVKTLRIGGQEFWVDNVCATP
jgi:hypothetical protein